MPNPIAPRGRAAAQERGEAKDDVKMWKTLYYAEQEARMKAERAREEAQAACEAIDKE
jgi:hypothetical protein